MREVWTRSPCLRLPAASRLESEGRPHLQRPPRSPAMPDTNSFEPFIILRCVVGSRAYGLDGEGSDTDRRGVYLPPASRHWSLAGVPDRLAAGPGGQDCYWELRPFLLLA